MLQIILFLQQRSKLLDSIFHLFFSILFIFLALISEDCLCSEHVGEELSILLDLLELICQFFLVLASVLQSRDVPGLVPVSLLIRSFKLVSGLCEESFKILDSSLLVIIFQLQNLKIILELINVLVHLQEVLGVIFSVGNQRELQVLVLLHDVVAFFIDEFQLLTQGDLDRVVLCELYHLLLRKLEVLLYQVLHLQQGICESLQVCNGVTTHIIVDAVVARTVQVYFIVEELCGDIVEFLFEVPNHVNALYHLLMDKLFALDIQVHPNNQLSIKDSKEDLLLKVIFEVQELCEELHVVRIGFLRVTEDLRHFILGLIYDYIPLVLNVFFLLLVVVLLRQGKHILADNNEVIDLFGDLVH